MTDQLSAAEKGRLIRYLRAKAHMLAVWEAPRVSREAGILNTAADELEAEIIPAKTSII